MSEKGRKVKKNASQPSGRALDLILITLIVFSVLGLSAIMIAAFGGFLN